MLCTQCPRAVFFSLFRIFSRDLDNQMTDFSFVKRFGSRLIFVERGSPKRVGLKVSPGCRWRQQISWGLTISHISLVNFTPDSLRSVFLLLNFSLRFGFLVTHLPDTQPFEVDRASGSQLLTLFSRTKFSTFSARIFVSFSFESFQILFSSRVMMAR